MLDQQNSLFPAQQGGPSGLDRRPAAAGQENAFPLHAHVIEREGPGRAGQRLATLQVEDGAVVEADEAAGAQEAADEVEAGVGTVVGEGVEAATPVDDGDGVTFPIFAGAQFSLREVAERPTLKDCAMALITVCGHLKESGTYLIIK